MNFKDFYLIEMPYFQDVDGTYVDLRAEDKDNKWIDTFIDVWNHCKTREQQEEMLKSFGLTIYIFIQTIQTLNPLQKMKILNVLPKDLTANNFEGLKKLVIPNQRK